MIPVLKQEEFSNWLLKKRVSFDIEDENVRSIIARVKSEGDAALKEITLKYDGANLENFKVSDKEIDEAFKEVSADLIESLKKAKENIWDFHKRQLKESNLYEKDGMFAGQLVKPIEKAGLYVPGGKGAYPSTVLMTAIPAKIAGVSKTVMVSPPSKEGKINPVLLVAAKICEVDEIYKVGGAHAVAALAYGTRQIPKVYKVVGPGNSYVTLAKKYLYGTIDIDSLAGPSEVMIVADETVSLNYVVTDLFAQAEHSEDAQSVVLVPSKFMADSLSKKVEEKLKESPRREILKRSVYQNSTIVVLNDIENAFDLVNEYAPEHLQFLTNKFSDQEIFEKVKNAGAIFIGPYTPVSLGDYFAGPNHTLPTSGTAVYASPLGVYDFTKYISVLKYSREKLLKDKKSLALIAEAEGFFEHANSVKVRE